MVLLFVASRLLVGSITAAGAEVVDEVHYTFTGPTSVAFDWRGTATDMRYGTTSSYGSAAVAHAPNPLPFSSAGPFQEVVLGGLQVGATYHYSIGGGVDHTFNTAPTGTFRFDVIADVGSSRDYSNVAPTQNQVAADNPAFVLVPGDLTYAEPLGQPAVDQHFNDVMAWSLQAAYMLVWGNYEWEILMMDDLRNYKGRFTLPNDWVKVNNPYLSETGDVMAFATYAARGFVDELRSQLDIVQRRRETGEPGRGPGTEGETRFVSPHQHILQAKRRPHDAEPRHVEQRLGGGRQGAEAFPQLVAEPVNFAG